MTLYESSGSQPGERSGVLDMVSVFSNEQASNVSQTHQSTKSEMGTVQTWSTKTVRDFAQSNGLAVASRRIIVDNDVDGTPFVFTERTTIL